MFQYFKNYTNNLDQLPYAMPAMMHGGANLAVGSVTLHTVLVFGHSVMDAKVLTRQCEVLITHSEFLAETTVLFRRIAKNMRLQHATTFVDSIEATAAVEGIALPALSAGSGIPALAALDGLDNLADRTGAQRLVCRVLGKWQKVAEATGPTQHVVVQFVEIAQIGDRLAVRSLGHNRRRSWTMAHGALRIQAIVPQAALAESMTASQQKGTMIVC